MKALGELRRSLGEDATYAVSKNTLTTIAAREAGVDGIEAHLVGPTAIAFIKGDPVIVAKGLRDFGRANPLLVIKGGVLEGKVMTPDEVRQARRPRVPRGAAGQGGRRHEGHPAAGDLAGRGAAVPGRPAVCRAAAGRGREPVVARRTMPSPSRPTPIWRRPTRPLPSRRTEEPAATDEAVVEPTTEEPAATDEAAAEPTNEELAAADEAAAEPTNEELAASAATAAPAAPPADTAAGDPTPASAADDN